MHPVIPDPDLLCRIPSDARLVLHVGCGDGALGAEHRRRNPTTRIVGLESDADAADAAAQRLDRVYLTDFARDPAPFAGDIQPGTVDCIIYEGPLGGAGDPWQVVRAHVGFLSAAGTVLLRSENVEHWRLLERSLKGMRRHEAGRASSLLRLPAQAIRTGLRSAGLVPIDCAARVADSDAGEAFCDALAPALRNLGIDPAAFGPRAAPAHHVWRARRQPVSDRLTVVSTMLSPVGGVSDVRVVEPIQALGADAGIVTAVIANNDDPPPNIEGPRIFIFHRPLLAGDPGLERVDALIRAGWVVVCEFDDHPDYIPVLQRPDIQNFRAVHAIQTTTGPLADVLRQYNPEVAIFRNAVARLPDPRNFARDDRLSLFFAGLNREGEWPHSIEAMNAVAARAQGRLHFEVVNDRAFFDALQTRHKSFTPLCDYALYLDLLAGCEISFMPLSDTPFNRCKSDLKFIEAAASRVAALASDVVYQDSIEDGRTGVLFRTAAELEQRLSRLVANPEIALSIGEAARRQVREHRMLAYQVSERAAWYRSLWDRREALNRALIARVPELANAAAVGA
jgi:hypothetical protein